MVIWYNVIIIAVVSFMFGYILSALMTASRIAELYQEIFRLQVISDSNIDKEDSCNDESTVSE